MNRRSTDTRFLYRYGWKILTAIGVVIGFVWSASATVTAVKSDIQMVNTVAQYNAHDITEVRVSLNRIADSIADHNTSMARIEAQYAHILAKLDERRK